MWKLTIEDDDGQRTALELGQPEYTVGRGEGSSIRLTERNVSRNHAALRQSNGAWMLHDDGSYNGTYVNGERVIDPVALANGTIVHIGDYRLELAETAQAAVGISPDSTPRAKRPDRLVMVVGPTPGMEFVLEGDRLSIGRAEEAHVSINHASVSRIHSELVALDQGRWEVIDQASSNGIRINGVALPRGILEPGDALELGDVRLRFVAAGKYFRPAVDLSQQLPVVGFDGMSPTASGAVAAQHARRSVGKVIVVGAIVGVLLVAGWAMFAGPSGSDISATDTGAPVATSDAEARVLLQEAAKIAVDDLDTAHLLLTRIPETSQLRETEEFRAIEDQWAAALFARAAAEKNIDEKRALLNQISETTTVSTDQRQRAANMALELGPAPVLRKPRVPGVGRPAVATPAKPDESPGGSASAKATAEPTAAPSAAPPPPAAKPDGRFDQDVQKRRLFPRVQAGTASKSEILMLRAICSNQGDRACRNMATQRLKAIKKKAQ